MTTTATPQVDYRRALSNHSDGCGRSRHTARVQARSGIGYLRPPEAGVKSVQSRARNRAESEDARPEAQDVLVASNQESEAGDARIRDLEAQLRQHGIAPPNLPA